MNDSELIGKQIEATVISINGTQIIKGKIIEKVSWDNCDYYLVEDNNGDVQAVYCINLKKVYWS